MAVSSMRQSDPGGILRIGSTLGRWIDRFSAGIGYFAATILVALTVLTFNEVIMRYVFKSPTKFTMEYSQYFFQWMILLALGYTLKIGSHIRVDFLTGKLAPRTNGVIETISLLIALVYSIILLVNGTRMTLDAFTTGGA